MGVDPAAVRDLGDRTRAGFEQARDAIEAKKQSLGGNGRP